MTEDLKNEQAQKRLEKSLLAKIDRQVDALEEADKDLADAKEELVKLGEPQPIATAPKGGGEVLGVDVEGNIGWTEWMEDMGCWSWDFDECAIGWWPKPKASKEKLVELGKMCEFAYSRPE